MNSKLAKRRKRDGPKRYVWSLFERERSKARNSLFAAMSKLVERETIEQDKMRKPDVKQKCGKKLRKLDRKKRRDSLGKTKRREWRL